MAASNIVYLQAWRPEAEAPAVPRVDSAFSAALLCAPPKPPGLATCVAWLQESAATLPSRRMGMRTLQNLRIALFTAPGRDAEMLLLWREALATACYARALAEHARFDASLLTGAGLLHRIGEIAAVRALAQAERDTGERLVGQVMQRIVEAGDGALVARVTRSWALPSELQLLILRWREEHNQARCPEAVSLLVMAQAFAAELVHADTCTPGLVEAAREVLGLSVALVEQTRGATAGIETLLAQVAPEPTPQG